MEITHLNKIQAAVLQPTPFCNINCRYCYLPGRTLKQVMSTAVLTRILEALFSSPLLADSLSLIWHAGEPLLVPLAFYQQAMSLIQRLNTRGLPVTSTFQTNATCVTPQWCAFLKQHGARISVSLDGPEHIHNHSRVYRNGRGTFAQTMHGVRLLQQNAIPFSTFAVLTRYSLDYPDEIWHFFHEHHLTSLSFNIEEVNGAHTHSSLNDDEDVENKYRRFLQRMLDLNARCDQPLLIREIDTFSGRILKTELPVFSQENIPGALISFDYAGNVSTFASELLTMKHPRHGDFLLGNILDSTLEELLASPKLLALNDEIQRGVERCRQSCHYFRFCGGGSPTNKFSEHGTLDATETLNCRLKIKATMDVMLDYEESRHSS